MKTIRTNAACAPPLAVLILLGSYTPTPKSTTSESQADWDSLPLAQRDISGRYKGKARDNNTGLILTQLSDQSYVAIVIVYTKLLGELRQGIDRVVNSVSLYRAAVTEGSPSARTPSLTLELLARRADTVTPDKNPALHLESRV